MTAEEFAHDEDLRESVRQLTDQLPSLTLQVRESNERSVQARRLTYWHTAIAAAIAVLMAGFLFIGLQVKESSDQIKDCTTPTGQCAKRAAATTSLFLSSSALRGERERLRTEVPIAEAKGDTQGAEMRRARLTDLDQQIAKVDQQLADIRSQKTRF